MGKSGSGSEIINERYPRSPKSYRSNGSGTQIESMLDELAMFTNKNLKIEGELHVPVINGK
jgi:hypothetical protein